MTILTIAEKTAQKTAQFAQMVEQAAFKLAALGKEANVVETVKWAWLDEWHMRLPEVVAIATTEDLIADLAKPRQGEEGEYSIIRRRGTFIWYEKPYPEMDEILAAQERGIARYLTAMEQPMPADWSWNYVPADAYLARFPEDILIRNNGQGQKINKFWMSAVDPRPQYHFPKAGEVVSPPWYAHNAHVGFGNVQGSIWRDSQRVEVGEGTLNNKADFKFVCPTPQELYEHLQAGGTVKELIRSRITRR